MTEHLQAELERLAGLQATIKRASMTYQREAKLEVARYYGLPFDAVDLPFEEWMALRERYESDIRNATPKQCG